MESAGPRPSALVVDDEPVILIALRRILSKAFDVVTASGGAEALELAATRGFDLVITDLSMPRTTGIDVIRRLRELGHREPAILLTANREADEVASALQEGLLAKVLSKPWNNEALLREALALVAPARP